ncbi:MAG: alpha/beta fold hydrolase [Myxococcales bacterium]|nr:alpha/beta fold hydrolase [Myxococcales bacterium]
MTWADLPEDVRALYPWKGADAQLSCGHRLHYLDEGKGEVLLMVHGNPTWSFYWRDLVKGLSDRYRCIVPDHVGSGLSDKPQSWTYRLQDHIDNLVELMDRLDLENVTMLVHDWGGAIGFGAACARPERIARLVVFNTSVFMEEVPLSIRLARKRLVGEIVVRGFNGFARAGLLRAIGDRGRMKGAVGRGYLAPYDSYDHRVAHLMFIRDIPLEDGHPTRVTIERMTKEVPEKFAKTPTLFIWGDKDFVFTPRFLEKWQKLLPQGEAHRFPDAAHWVVEDAHERILPLVEDFLARHPLPKDPAQA